MGKRATVVMQLESRQSIQDKAMFDALSDAMKASAEDANTKAVVLTGTDPYYSSGADFGAFMTSCLQSWRPSVIHETIRANTVQLFGLFVHFPKVQVQIWYLFSCWSSSAAGGGGRERPLPWRRGHHGRPVRRYSSL